MLQKTKIDNKLFLIKNTWCNDVLSWYKENKRNLPWRKKKNQNFYSIWLSEIMLQQTNVNTVIPYYNKFKKKWPTLESFQSAKFEELMIMWQGLGYYRRAKNFFDASKILKNYNLKNYNDLVKIPGIGKYTASALMAILYDAKIGVIDTNITRIFSRVFSVNFKDSSNQKLIEEIAYELAPSKHNGLYCQSLMDIGALICKQEPDCKVCPVNQHCDSLNLKKKNYEATKKLKIKKIGVVFYVKCKNSVLTQKSDNNFLHGLLRFPTSDFYEVSIKNRDFTQISLSLRKSLGLRTEGKDIGFVNHPFTNFYLQLLVVKIQLKSKNDIKLNGNWIDEFELSNFPFSRLMEKVRTKVIGLDDKYI
ncbi:MAG: hypothetical protein CMP33_02185 [Rickettsiales bacterium]|nr:hypothetical protein [Rickettsiales bacterium]